MQTQGSFKLVLFLIFWGGTSAAALHAQQTPETSGKSAQLRDYDSHSPFTAPEDLQQWEQRAKAVRLQVAVSTGMHPSVDLPDVAPQVYGRVVRDDYSINRIVFESLPGMKVTGSLYLPHPLPKEKIPGVLCPHGHWEEARFRAAPEDEVKRELATGAERFENAARHHIQARCVQLARMGCAVLHWDMIGYCDSQQISFDRSHRFANQDRASEVAGGGWLLFSPEAEMRMQSLMGLQSLATQRAVDALLTLKYVDPDRIAITGASGGGTQSFIGAALDPRIAVAFPAVMVSTGMQGGCTCENASMLRLGTSNAEIAALIAPRPLGMTAANDWTRNMQQDGFPQIQAVYSLLGQSSKVALFPSLHFGHNFNHVSRVSMYGWMNKELGLGLPEPVLERDFDPALPDELTVWDDQHPRPDGGLDFERQLMRRWEDLVHEAFASASHDQRQTWQREGWGVLLGETIPDGKLPLATPGETELTFEDGLLGEWSVTSAKGAVKDAAPAAVERGEGEPGDKPLGDKPLSVGVLMKYREAERANSLVFPGLSSQQQQLVDNPRLAAAYTYAYNLTHFAKQARRLAQTLRSSGALERDTMHVVLEATGADAAVVLAAVFYLQMRGDDTTRIELNVDLDGFDFDQVESIRAPAFLPGAIKYGGVDALRELVQAA